jgi:hypothetical protein
VSRRHVPTTAAEPPARDVPARADYFCRGCRTTAPAAVPRVPPRGWFLLNAVRRDVPDNITHRRDRYARLGVYCSTACLAAALPHIGGVDDPAAPTQEGPTDG